MNDPPPIRVIADFPDYGVSADRRVWSRRGRRGGTPYGPCDDWKPLRPCARSRKSGSPTVLLYLAGDRRRPHTRTVERLHREAFAGTRPPPPLPPGGGKGYPDADADADAPAAPAGRGAAPGDGRRPVRGFAGYAVAADLSVWSSKGLAWRRLATYRRDGLECVSLWRGGKSWVRSVAKLVRLALLDEPPGPPGGPLGLGPTVRGSAHGRARLDEGRVLELRRLRAEGWAVKALAARYEVSPSTVRAILKGETWRHAVAGPSPLPRSSEGPS